MCNVNDQDDQRSVDKETGTGHNSKSFEEALSETGFGILNYFLIVVAGCILGTVLFETLGISYALPVTDCDLHLTTQQKGVLSTIGFVGIIASSHLWGFLADTKGRRRIIRPTLQIAFAFTFISSFLENFWALLICRFLSGFFVSGGSATVYAYLGEFHSDQIRSKAIMGASVIFGFAALLMPVFAWLVINQTFQLYIPFIGLTFKPWRLFLIVCGLPGLICSLCLYIIPESPKYTFLEKGNEEAIIVLRKVYAMNTRRDEETYPVNQIKASDEFRVESTESSTSNPIMNIFKSMWRQTYPLFQKVFIRQTTLGCLLQFITFISANGMYMWFPDILDQIGAFRISNPMNGSTICEIVRTNRMKNTATFSTSSLHITPNCRETLDITAYQSSIYLEIIYIISFALIGFIINIVGKVPIMFVIMVGTGACSLALIYVANPLISICLFVAVMLSGLSTVVVNAAMVELFPTSLRAMAVCITLMIGRSGSVVGANVIGALLDYDCEGAFIFSGITLIGGGFLGFLLPKKPNSKLQGTVESTIGKSNDESIKSTP